MHSRDDLRRRKNRLSRSAARISLAALCLSTIVLHTAGSLYPPTFQIARDNLAIVVQDYARVPLSTTTPSTYPPSMDFTNQLARVSIMRFEPGSSPLFSSRLFASDLNRNLYILDISSKTFTTYINFEEVFPKFRNRISLGAGLAALAFDPGYEQNGKFYTVHLEGPQLPGDATPVNTSLPGLDLTGYQLTASVDPPFSTIERHAVLVEWNDLDRSNVTFEGTAREILRVGFTDSTHSIADMLFNPSAQIGHPDYGNLYIAVGDGGAGKQTDERREIPQRLDMFPGKILRITPDRDLRPSDEISSNGRYRIPTTGPDPNPFVALGASVRKEIFSYGHRNPQRMSWDHVSNLLIVAEIGVGSWEEINIIRKGENYGFAEREGGEQMFVGGVNDEKTGSQTVPPTPFPDPDTLFVEGLGPITPRYPVAAFSHRDGDAIAGGFVYRGSRLPELQGKYVFGDVTTARLFYVDLADMIAADDGDAASLAPIRELQILYDSPYEVPDRGAAIRRLFDIIGDEYRERGGTASDGAVLPRPEHHLSDGVDPDGIPFGGGRADIRLSVDRDGELYILSKADGVIRAIVGTATGTTASTLQTSLNPSLYEESVQLTARVVAHPDLPPGSVEFFDGQVSLGVAELSDGIATLNVAALAPGTHTLTTRYLGNLPIFLGSVSLPVTHLVAAPNSFRLNVEIGGTAGGSVSSAPAGIACPGTCAYPFAGDSTVILTANPETASRFTGWSGACSGTETCNVSITAATSVTATFAPNGPDLVSAIGVLPATAAPGVSVAIQSTTTNQGWSDAAGSTTRYYLSNDAVRSAGDLLFGTRSIGPLAAGSSVVPSSSFTLPAATALGAYHVLACADDLVKVVELDEQNNCGVSAELLTVSQPDLVTIAIGSTSAHVAPGATLGVTDTVRNQGGHSAAKSTTRYYLSGDAARSVNDLLLKGTRSVSALTPNASSTGSKTVTVPAAAALGAYYLLACADDQLKVLELVESNNCVATAEQVVVGRPDLVISSVDSPPPQIAAAESFTVNAMVTNQGTASARSSTLRYYLSLDGVKDLGDALLTGTRSVSALSPQQSLATTRSVTVPSTTSPGAYQLFACADDLGVVAELDDTNNCTAAATSIVVIFP